MKPKATKKTAAAQPAVPITVAKSSLEDIVKGIKNGNPAAANAAGIPKSIQDIMAQAGQVIGVGPGGATMTLGMGTNGAMSFGMEDEVEAEPEVPKVIGKYKPRTTFHDFIGTVGNVNVLSKEATLDGKFFDSMNLEGVKFKVTLRDDNTFDIEEVGTNIVTEAEIKRYVTMFDESPVAGYRDRSVATDFVFTATHTVKGKTINLESYLVVDPRKPYNDLLDLLNEEDDEPQVEASTEETSEVIDEFDAKMKALFGDDEDEAPAAKVEPPVPNAYHTEPITSVRQQMSIEFLEAKKEKRVKLVKKIDNYKEDLKKAKNAQHTAFTKIRECNDEIKLLASRIDSLEINEPANGYYFFVPESKSDVCHLDDATRDMIINKLVNMNYPNTEGFMTLFNNALFQIRIGLDTDNGLVELTDFKNVMQYFKDFDLDVNSKLYVSNGGLFYEGQLEWSDIGNKLVRLGFASNHKFDELFATVEEDMENMMNGDTDEDYVSETLAEFEDTNGYEMGDEFLFAIGYVPAASNAIGDPQVWIGITPKSYFDNEGCAYDGHIHEILKTKFPVIDDLEDWFSEDGEGSFSMCKDINTHEDINTIIDTVCKAGIKFSAKFQDFMSAKDTGLVTYIIATLGHTSSII
jgi:hypothetical protein